MVIVGITRRLLIIFLVSLVTVFSIGLAIGYLKGYRILNVQTDSMVPVIYPGDAVIIKPSSLNDIEVGDTLSYESLHEQNVLVTHRVVSVDKVNGKIVTKGDSLDIYDPAVHYSRVIGRVSIVLPYSGGWLASIKSPLGLIIAVYIPSILIFYLEIRRLVREWAV